jgi:hypothetical protein
MIFFPSVQTSSAFLMPYAEKEVTLRAEKEKQR